MSVYISTLVEEPNIEYFFAELEDRTDLSMAGGGQLSSYKSRSKKMLFSIKPGEKHLYIDLVYSGSWITTERYTVVDRETFIRRANGSYDYEEAISL